MSSRFWAGLAVLSLLGLPVCATAADAPKAPPPGYVAREDDTSPKGSAPGMTVTEFAPAGGHVYKIHFKPGDDVVAGMIRFSEAHKFRQATMTGIGGFASAVLAWYDPSNGFFKTNAVGKCEVTSFTGTISTDDKGHTTFHAHVALGFSDGSAKAGHLVSAVINPTMEIYVTDLGEGRDVK